MTPGWGDGANRAVLRTDRTGECEEAERDGHADARGEIGTRRRSGLVADTLGRGEPRREPAGGGPDPAGPAGQGTRPVFQGRVDRPDRPAGAPRPGLGGEPVFAGVAPGP